MSGNAFFVLIGLAVAAYAPARATGWRPDNVGDAADVAVILLSVLVWAAVVAALIDDVRDRRR